MIDGDDNAGGEQELRWVGEQQQQQTRLSSNKLQQPQQQQQKDLESVMAISSEQFYGNSSTADSISSANRDQIQNATSPKSNTTSNSTTTASPMNANKFAGPRSASEKKLRPSATSMANNNNNSEFRKSNNLYKSPGYSPYSNKRTSSSPSSYSFKSKSSKDQRKVYDTLPRKPPLSDDNNRLNYSSVSNSTRRNQNYFPLKFNLKPRTASQASPSQKENAHNNNKSPEKMAMGHSPNNNNSLLSNSDPNSPVITIDENSNHDRIPQGLENYGNTCYVNSVLQTLFSLNFFMDKLTEMIRKRRQNEFDPEQLKKLPLVFKLIDFYEEFTSLYPAKNTLNNAVVTIKNCIAEHVAPTFASPRQQCAAEFLTVILEELKNEFDFLTGKNSPNLIDKTFHYTLIQRRYCPCCDKNISETSYVSSTFYLALTENRSVQSSFLHFLNEEDSNGSKCAECNSKIVASKLFNDVPKVLFFQLVRYSNEFMKDTMAFDASAFIYLPKKFFKNQEMFFSPIATPYKRGLRNIQPLYSNLKKDSSCVKKLDFDENELSNLPMITEDGDLYDNLLSGLDKHASSDVGNSDFQATSCLENVEPILAEDDDTYEEDELGWAGENSANNKNAGESLLQAAEAPDFEKPGPSSRPSSSAAVTGTTAEEVISQQHSPPPDHPVEGEEEDDDNNNIHEINSVPSSEDIDANSERYQLVSIISHHGSQIDFGHYTACVFNSARSSWFYCDDKNIQPVQFDYVRNFCSRTGCCYLYVHCDP